MECGVERSGGERSGVEESGGVDAYHMCPRTNERASVTGWRPQRRAAAVTVADTSRKTPPLRHNTHSELRVLCVVACVCGSFTNCSAGIWQEIKRSDAWP